MGNQHRKQKTQMRQNFEHTVFDCPSIHRAVDLRDTNEIMRLLRRGHDINKRDKSGLTCLHYSALNGSSDIVQLLLSNGAEIRTAQLYIAPIHFAVPSGNVEVVDLLLNNGDGINAFDSIGNSPLSLAIEYEHPDIVMVLLNRGASLRPGYVMTAIENGSIDILKSLIRFRPSVLSELDFSKYRYTDRSDECMRFLISVGVHFKSDFFLYRGPYGATEFMDRDNKIIRPPPHWNKLEDPKSFEIFNEFFDGHCCTLPLSLQELSRLAFYSGCKDKSIAEVLSSLKCPNAICSYLMLENC